MTEQISINIAGLSHLLLQLQVHLKVLLLENRDSQEQHEQESWRSVVESIKIAPFSICRHPLMKPSSSNWFFFQMRDIRIILKYKLHNDNN